MASVSQSDLGAREKRYLDKFEYIGLKASKASSQQEYNELERDFKNYSAKFEKRIGIARDGINNDSEFQSHRLQLNIKKIIEDTLKDTFKDIFKAQAAAKAALERAKETASKVTAAASSSISPTAPSPRADVSAASTSSSSLVGAGVTADEDDTVIDAVADNTDDDDNSVEYSKSGDASPASSPVKAAVPAYDQALVDRVEAYKNKKQSADDDKASPPVAPALSSVVPEEDSDVVDDADHVYEEEVTESDDDEEEDAEAAAKPCCTLGRVFKVTALTGTIAVIGKAVRDFNPTGEFSKEAASRMFNGVLSWAPSASTAKEYVGIAWSWTAVPLFDAGVRAIVWTKATNETTGYANGLPIAAGVAAIALTCGVAKIVSCSRQKAAEPPVEAEDVEDADAAVDDVDAAALAGAAVVEEEAVDDLEQEDEVDGFSGEEDEPEPAVVQQQALPQEAAPAAVVAEAAPAHKTAEEIDAELAAADA